MQGNIWFCGPNQNRFFSPGGNDIFEYRNAGGSFENEYSLSCSREIVKEHLPNIKITNPRLFVQEIIDAIKLKESVVCHKISWLCKECLSREDLHNHIVNKQPLISSAINMIDKFPQNNEKVTLYVASVGATKARYAKKITQLSESFSSPEIAMNAKDHHDVFQHEKEIRIHINTGDFLGGYEGNCLIDLVQYLKIFCPGVGKYCEPV